MTAISRRRLPHHPTPGPWLTVVLLALTIALALLAAWLATPPTAAEDMMVPPAYRIEPVDTSAIGGYWTATGDGTAGDPGGYFAP